MENKRIVSIHQPNLFPWLGYFYKIFTSDIFILLDDVQMQKTGSNYTNRASVLNLNGETKFLTIPIPRPSGVQLISEVVIVDKLWQKKFIGFMQSNYSRAKFYKKNKEIIFNLVDNDISNLADFNSNFITEICENLELSHCEIAKSSNLDTMASSTERLVDLVNAVEGTIYLSGHGGVNYQDEQLFSQNQIELNYIDYPDFAYDQIGSPMPIKGLSIIDAIFNIDFEGIRDMFNQSLEDPR